MTHSKVEFDALSSELCGFLRKHIVAPHLDFGPTTPLSRLGVDSVSIVQMLLFVERRFGIEIPDSELTHRNLESVDSLARSVMSLLDQGKETTGFPK